MGRIWRPGDRISAALAAMQLPAPMLTYCHWIQSPWRNSEGWIKIHLQAIYFTKCFRNIIFLVQCQTIACIGQRWSIANSFTLKEQWMVNKMQAISFKYICIVLVMMTRCNLTRYYSAITKQEHRSTFESTKMILSRPHGWDVGCLLWVFWRKSTLSRW